jgi:hypothetical protein
MVVYCEERDRFVRAYIDATARILEAGGGPGGGPRYEHRTVEAGNERCKGGF